MRDITISIPTSWGELKQYIRERTSKRRQHNIKVFRRFVWEIENEVANGYWKNDISEPMRHHVFDGAFPHSKINMLFNKLKKELR